MNVTESIFTKLALARQRFVKKSYTKFHENSTDGLIVDTRSRMDGWTWSSQRAFLLLYVVNKPKTPSLCRDHSIRHGPVSNAQCCQNFGCHFIWQLLAVTSCRLVYRYIFRGPNVSYCFRYSLKVSLCDKT
jgi:hypothetical protein